MLGTSGLKTRVRNRYQSLRAAVRVEGGPRLGADLLGSVGGIELGRARQRPVALPFARDAPGLIERCAELDERRKPAQLVECAGGAAAVADAQVQLDDPPPRAPGFAMPFFRFRLLDADLGAGRPRLLRGRLGAGGIEVLRDRLQPRIAQIAPGERVQAT